MVFTDDETSHYGESATSGDKVRVFWYLDNSCFVDTLKRSVDDVQCRFVWYERDNEGIHFIHETYLFSFWNIAANSTNSQNLRCLFERFWNKSVIRFHSQGFAFHTLANSNNSE